MVAHVPRAETRRIAEALVRLGQDLARIAGPADFSDITTPAATVLSGRLDRDPADIRPDLSAHKRLEILARCQPGPGNPVTELEALICGIPPLLPTGAAEPQVSFIVGRQLWNGHCRQDLRIDGICLVDSNKPVEISSSLYAFLRIHANIALRGTLEPWTIDQRPADCPMEILADSAENAAARFAACSPEVRKQIQKGQAPRIMPSDRTASERLKAIVSRRVPAGA